MRPDAAYRVHVACAFEPMDTTTALFYIFSAVMLIAAFRVITARSAVHSALFLVLAFFSASCVWILLRAEFLAIALVLVYVGAVMVLFLFVVMMLDISSAPSVREGFWKHFPVAALVGVIIVLEMALVLIPGFDIATAPPLDEKALALGNTKLLGIQMYTNYLYPLQIAAVVLLVAIISAIALTLRKRGDSKALNPSEQVRVKKGDRLRVVSMNAVVEPPPAPPETPPGDVK